MAKKVSFDPTSFNFGANRKARKSGKGKPKGKAPHAMGPRPGFRLPNGKMSFGGGS